MRLADFEALSFDCYGTLIDWETGLWAALAPQVRRAGLRATADEVFAIFAGIENALEAANPTLLYRDLLAEVYRRLAQHFHFTASEPEAHAFAASIRNWPVFPDTRAALMDLQRHYRLFVLSNVDRQSFAHSQAKLGVVFEGVFTAEDIGSYKPDRRNFEYLILRLAERGFAKKRVLHVAQSPFHDIAPAKAMGMATCWIDRRAGKTGFGATPRPPAGVVPDFRFTSLAQILEARRRERGPAPPDELPE